MGLIQTALSSATGVLADQWKEYFYCEAIPNDILVVKGQKKVSSRSSNKGADNIISNGSLIAVADGQCMLIVEQGKVVEVCAEPGEFKYDSSTEPSIFAGNLGDNIKEIFGKVCKRFTFGGEITNDQRVYYFNTKEIIGNKYGTPSMVPFRVVDERAGIDMDISIRCFGEYSYKLVNPLLFYTNVCGNVTSSYKRSDIDSQMKSELLNALQPAFAKISAQGIRYSALPGHTTELSNALKEELSAQWKDFRGIEIQRVAVSSVKASEDDEATIKQMQKAAAYTNVNLRDANMAAAQMSAMNTAAGNANGAAMGFMGMNMAGGNGYQYQTSYQQPTAAPAANGWTCPTCGKVNKGKFCAECGTKKPADAPLYKCDKCGWEPEDPQHPPKFCPECGDLFDDSDIVS